MGKLALILLFAPSISQAKQNLLLLGDSHTAGHFGQSMIRQLEVSGRFSVNRQGVVGHAAKDWLGKFESLQKTAEAVVIALGTNDAAKASCNGTGAASQLLSKLGHEKKCIWIGPPGFEGGGVIKSCGSRAKYDEFVKRLKAVVEKHGCEYIDSRKFTLGGGELKPDLSDKVHFSKDAAAEWARQAGPLTLRKLSSGSNSPGARSHGAR